MLMMNGGLDPATPLAQAVSVKDPFQGQNHTFIEFADEGHGVSPSGFRAFRVLHVKLCSHDT